MARLRQPSAPVAGGPFPADLAMGPCIEVWADQASSVASLLPWYRARVSWRDSVHDWALRTGWARQDRPADNACNLARTRLPWSRAWLLEHGHKDFVDYFEGRSSIRPHRPQPWDPMHD